MKQVKHRWNTNHYEKYTDLLNRTDLNKLYPSESWCLYRTLKKSKDVVDLGCGNGAMSSISRKIKNKIKYYGVDHQKNLIRRAKKKFIHSKFIDEDLKTFLKMNTKKFDTVMAWSVIKSFKNWRFIIKKMIESAKKYVIFDQRVANVNFTSFDTKILAANYDGVRGPLLCINYKTLKNELLKYTNKASMIELMAYQSEWGRNVDFKFRDKIQTFVVTIVIHLKNNKRDKYKGIYEQLPLNLKK